MLKDDILDQNILSDFKNIFKAMNISEYQIITEIQNFSLPPLDFETREKLSTEGVTFENFSDEWIEIAEPQLFFKYKKNVVIMYQLDQFLTQADYDKKNYRAFHLCFCQALRDAHEKNRYESRYVATYNPNGLFKVNLFVRDKNFDGKIFTLKKEKGIFLQLKVCQHCLREINWKHFRQYCGGGLNWWLGGNKNMRQKIADEFDLEEYFITARENNFFEHPVFGTASSTIKKEYVLSPQIKEELKKIVEYTCDICHNQFSSDELQIHHKNHNEGDNRRQNLMVVCENCHALIHEAEGGFFSKKEKSVKPIDFAVEKYIFSDYDALRQKRLGDMFFNGFGVPKDEQQAQIFYRKAAESYKKLADKGDINAKYELANLYLKMRGVEKISIEAKRLFESVIEEYRKSKDIKAEIRLGLMYAKGLGVAKNLYEAKKIISDIKNFVEVTDIEFIELCLATGNIDDALKFHAKALQIFEIAAANGNSNANFELATLYNKKELFVIKSSNCDEKFYKKFYETAMKEELARQAEIERQKEIESKKVYWDGKKKNAVGTIYLREGITSIKFETFKECKKLEKIILPESLTSIGNYAFEGCKSLKEIEFPDSVTSIGWKAFYGCDSLKKIEFPKSLTSIDNYAFYDCDSLKEIKLPENLISIGVRAFFGCSSLKEIKFPKNLNSIGSYAFYNCYILKRIIYYKRTEKILRDYFSSKWDALEKIVIDE